MEFINPEIAAQIVQQSNLIAKASVADQLAQRPFSVQKEVFDLSTAKLDTAPHHIRGQFKSLYIQAATDTLAYIEVKLGSRDTTQSPFNMKLNDSVSMDLPMSEAFLSWPAQAGKTLTLIKFSDARFESGSQISVTGGGVSIVDGSSFTNERVDLTAATAVLVASSDSTRKKATITNNSPADVWFGASSVSNTGANLGIRVPTGGILVWQNTAALYAYSVLASAGDVGLHVMKEY